MKPQTLTNNTWQSLVEASEVRAITLTLAQRNAIWDAASYLTELEETLVSIATLARCGASRETIAAMAERVLS